MVIEFSCPNCGMQFKVSAKVAGKKGKCKKCRHLMNIPVATPPAVAVEATGMFRLATAGSHAGVVSAATAVPAEPQPKAEESELELALITQDLVKPVAREKRKPREVIDPASLKLAPLSQKHTPLGRGPQSSQPPGPVQQVYRKQLRNVSGLLSKFNNFAYLISIPFILLFLVAIVMKQGNLVVLGATAVVLLSIGRLLATLGKLAIIPFRDSPLEGILFFVPPLTFYYMYKHWKQMKQDASPLVAPIVIIVAVVLAFQYVPWLAQRDVDKSVPIQDRIKKEAGELNEAISGELNQAVEKVKEISD